MSELLQTIKNLRELNLRPPRQSFALTEIEKIRAELEKIVDEPSAVTAVEREALLEKWLDGDRYFSRREIKNLPFIVYDDRVSLTEIFEVMDLSKEIQLKNLIAVYFSNYDGSEKTMRLRHRIGLAFVEKPTDYKYRSKMLARIRSEGLFLFDDDCIERTARLFINASTVEDVLSSLGLSNYFKGSNFICWALKKFWGSFEIDINRRVAVLCEIAEASDDKYIDVIQSAANDIIPDVDLMNTPSKRAAVKEKCLEIFYRELGDPRFGSLTYRWDKVSPRALEIFLHWIAESDLDLFFKIIDRAAVDRMWRYRKNFWANYLPYISNTWVFLGKDAQRIAKHVGDKVLYHGKLVGGGSDQSVLVFRIGAYVFIEWSHNGKLRVYYYDDVKDWFGAKEIKRNNIVYSFAVREWVHSSPLTYTWQTKVGDWIFSRCGLRAASDDERDLD